MLASQVNKAVTQTVSRERVRGPGENGECLFLSRNTDVKYCAGFWYFFLYSRLITRNFPHFQVALLSSGINQKNALANDIQFPSF